MSEEQTKQLRLTRPISSLVHQTSSRSLLGSHRQLLIEQNGDIYSLRLTKRGKLILTK